MNTLFRVLYTVAMQWRTLLMYCGPEGSAAYCWSPLGREMVRLQMMMMMMMILSGLRMDDWTHPPHCR